MNSSLFKKRCVKYNKLIKESGLVKLTWGNVSIRNDQKVFIKPSGVPFFQLKEEDISVVDINTKKRLSGLKPSVDTDIHIEIYRSFSQIKSIIHTHSKFATSWAQAETSIPCLGTTHADYFEGDVPIIRNLTQSEIENNYESNIGKAVIEYFKNHKTCPIRKGAVLLPKHGVLTFGKDEKQAFENSLVLEEIAEMALLTLSVNNANISTKDQKLLFKKHYDRKHGVDKYYGQG